MKYFIRRKRNLKRPHESDDAYFARLSDSGQSGFTLIEVLISVVLLSGLLVGFRYTLLAYWQQINRSWAERYMEQYGNSTVEFIARNIVNAKAISVSPNSNNMATFYVTLDDNITQSVVKYSCSPDEGVEVDNEKLFSDFPPENFEDKYSSVLGLNEKFEIIEFRIDSVYKSYTPYFNPVEFAPRLYKVTLRIAFEQEHLETGDMDYYREMVFTSQVSLKNRDRGLEVPN